MEDIRQKLAELKLKLFDEDRNVIKEKILDQSPCIVTEMKTGLIIFATKRINETFGYIYNELEGKKVTDLMPESYRGRHDAHLQKYSEDPRFRNMGTLEMKLKGVKKSGEEFEIKISLEPFFHDQMGFVLATIFQS
jgi:PAS domain S-box-containing protein